MGALSQQSPLFEQAIARKRLQGDKRTEAQLHMNYARAWMRREQLEEATTHLELGRTLAQEVGDTSMDTWMLSDFAVVERKRGNLERAVAMGRDVVARRTEEGEPLMLAYARLHLADAERESGAYETALNLAEQALEGFGDDTAGQIQGRVMKARVLLASGAEMSALEPLREAIGRLAETIDGPQLVFDEIATLDAEWAISQGPSMLGP